MNNHTEEAPIADALAHPIGTHFAPFRGGYQELPVVRIDQSALIYRADNGRLIAEIEQLHGGDANRIARFRDDGRTPEVQSELHRLLVEKASDPSGPILLELRRLRQQTEPLLITREGVVINGNRRLSAMRALLAEDAAEFEMFETVTAAVLPADAGAADVEFIEAALQMAPETKLAYGWINRRLKLRDQKDRLGLSDGDIASAYRMPTEAIARERAELELAEAYLAWIGSPGVYSEIADAELLFVGLAGQLEGMAEDLLPIWKLASFALIRSRGSAKGELATVFPFAEPNPAYAPRWIMNNLAAEQGGERVDEAAPLSDAKREALQVRLRDPAAAAANARSLTALFDLLRVVHREREAPDRLVKQVRGARRTIESIKPHDLTPEHARSLRSELAAIQAHAGFLIEGAPAPVIRNPLAQQGRAVWRAVRKRLRS